MRQAKEVVLLVLTPVPLGQISITSFLIYKIGIIAPFYLTETT